MKNLRKLFLIILLPLFISITNISYADIIKKVKVVGNDRISLETILIFGDVEVGKDYKSQDIKLLIKKLYETNFFSDISVELNNNVLSINVKYLFWFLPFSLQPVHLPSQFFSGSPHILHENTLPDRGEK